jgi:hypothetical protein
VVMMASEELDEPTAPARILRRRRQRAAASIGPVPVSVQRDARVARKQARERRQGRIDTLLAAFVSSSSDTDELLN